MTEIKLGKYRHYKGKEYEILRIARHSETLEELVVYRALYNSPEFGENALWVRPKAMFLGNIIVDQTEVQRFKYVGE